MTKQKAGQKLRQVLTSCTPKQARDVNSILEIGAGDIPPPKWAIFSGPEGMPNERRHAYMNLVNAVYEVGSRHESEPEWTPVHAGAWKSALATLAIEEDWEKIERAAKGLRGEDVEEHAQYAVVVKKMSGG